MKISKSLCLLIIILFVGCAAKEQMVLVGPQQTPLSPETDIEIIAWSKCTDYELVAVAEISEKTLEKRLLKAQNMARMVGATTVMPKGISDLSADNSNNDGSVLQSFLILRKLEKPPVEEEPVVEEIPSKKFSRKKIAEKSTEPVDNNNLPRAQYRLLVEEYAALRDEKFKSELYPAKIIWSIPAEIKSLVGKDELLIIAETSNKNHKIYITLPVSMKDDIKEDIENEELLSIVYSPIGVYELKGKKYPVLKYIETIE